MIYLDYSATTPTDKVVLNQFVEDNVKYFANPNSTHELGILAKQEIKAASKDINRLLGLDNYEVIYTSGATESNNLALKGFALQNSYKGRHIITSPYEHSSVTTVLNYLAKNDFDVDVLELNDDGTINLNQLEELIRFDTILISISLINSELGIKQDLDAIKKIINKHSHVVFHSDMTQAIGKGLVDLSGIDMISFSGHKIYGLKGIGAMLRKKSIDIIPVIHGGKSSSIYRGGTPPAPLILSLRNALNEALKNLDSKIIKISELKSYLINMVLPEVDDHNLNYPNSIPQIINVSFPQVEAHVLQKELSKREIFISTQTACASESSFSVTVKKVTGSDKLASSSVRISLSHLTTKEELNQLRDGLKEILG